MQGREEALPAGFVLADRFTVVDVLGRGGFGIVYLAEDKRFGDQVVVKELAPPGSARVDDGLLDLESLGHDQAHHLRHRFLEEARMLSKIGIRGVPTVRAAFGENGTAYYAIEHVQGAQTLEDILAKRRRLEPREAEHVLLRLLDILELLHAKRLLHRDIKPSNILVDPKGDITLIDFGAAREWHADASVHHTVLFTPGYAPLEQLSPKGRRGPATDLYAACATAYHMLTGAPPQDAAARAHGGALAPLPSYVDAALANAIEQGLSLRYEDRPQSVQEFRQILSDGPLLRREPTLAELDQTLVALRKFSFDRKACPSCGEVLEEPKPLKRHVCPVCRKGAVRLRELNDRICPVCRSSVLNRVKNSGPLAYCPCCRTGELAHKRVSFLGGKQLFECKECGSKFDSTPGGMAFLAGACRMEQGFTASYDDWRNISRRSAEVWRCDGCHAQFDTMPDGRRKQTVPEETARSLYPEEWARVAAKLDPSAGNAACDHCHAEFETSGERTTLIRFTEDPYGFGDRHSGRLMHWDDARWLGVGKESPMAGLVCHSCETEFDRDGDFLRLIRTENPRLIRHVDEPMVLEDWHRLAQGLPSIHEEQEFLDSLDEAVARAYVSGELGFDNRGEVVWSGPATRIDSGEQSGNLTIRREEIAFGGMLRKWRTPLDAISSASSEEGLLLLRLTGSVEPVALEIDPIQLTAALASGRRTVTLGAPQLAERISTELQSISRPV